MPRAMSAVRPPTMAPCSHTPDGTGKKTSCSTRMAITGEKRSAAACARSRPDASVAIMDSFSSAGGPPGPSSARGNIGDRGHVCWALDLLDQTVKSPAAYVPICPGVRSEEHTSELQSLMRSSYAVFCLKKKKYIKPT